MSEQVIIRREDMAPVTEKEKEDFLDSFTPHINAFETANDCGMTKRDIFIMAVLLKDALELIKAHDL